VNFQQKIDYGINDRVHELKAHLEKVDSPGIKFIVPSYCSLLVGFDKSHISYQNLATLVSGYQFSQIPYTASRKFWTIPVCYEKDFAPDLDFCCDLMQLEPTQIIQIHTSVNYRVFTYGFLPGFAYLGITDQKLFVPRKELPRQKVEKGSVGLAGNQTGIYPGNIPGGWQIIGKTPLSVVRNVSRGEENQYIFSPGDFVKFKAIKVDKFQGLSEEENSGKIKLTDFYEIR